MAAEPIAPITGKDFLNRIRTVLDASLQRWSFADFPEYAIDAYVASVQFANGHTATILYRRGWQVTSDNPLLPADDLRELLDNPRLQIEAGKFYRRRDGKILGPAKYDPWSNEDPVPWNLGGGRCYANDGTSGIAEYDLIREAPAPAGDEATPCGP